MDIHQNVRLTPRGREALAETVLLQGVTLNSAAAEFKVSAETARKWVRRCHTEGLSGLQDRSSRPWHSPRATAPELTARVVELRHQQRPAYHIAHATGLSPATVSRILRRAHLSRWRDLHPAPPVAGGPGKSGAPFKRSLSGGFR
jgi:transposase